MKKIILFVFLSLAQFVYAGSCEKNKSMLSMDLELVEVGSTGSAINTFHHIPLYMQGDSEVCTSADGFKALLGGFQDKVAGIRVLPKGDLWIKEKADGGLYLTMALDIQHSSIVEGKKLSQLTKSCDDYRLSFESREMKPSGNFLSLKIDDADIKRGQGCQSKNTGSKIPPMLMKVYLYSDAVIEPEKMKSPDKAGSKLKFNNPQLEKESNKNKRLKKI